ncbi:MAG: Stealth CR1 domain-containing protein [Lachnospiraceae bacterium]|nr:Stealth CR1 domain-containing protein [Lachnospiraceae bacterium]
MKNDIDLVVTWVDGSDPAWLAQRKKYALEKDRENYSWTCRDWGWMRYWFRGVEQNLPWIRKIHFLTWGHLPQWLNANHPKLHIVKHEDFIPAEFRPTFSANPIELNVHRIEGLSEQFIYTNDDIIFTGSIASDYYFQDGHPCDCLCLRPITESCKDGFGHILWNNIACINRQFSLRECMEKNKEKWFAPSYPLEVLKRNVAGYELRHFSGFRDEHLPIPFLKSTFAEVWETVPQLLRSTCNHRFRSNEDVSDWLVRYWQLAKGEFVPRSPLGKAVSVTSSPEFLRDTILNPLNPVICLNEGTDEIDFEERSAYLRSLLDIVLPQMSSFELY